MVHFNNENTVEVGIEGSCLINQVIKIQSINLIILDGLYTLQLTQEKEIKLSGAVFCLVFQKNFLECKLMCLCVEGNPTCRTQGVDRVDIAVITSK